MMICLNEGFEKKINILSTTMLILLATMHQIPVGSPAIDGSHASMLKLCNLRPKQVSRVTASPYK